MKNVLTMVAAALAMGAVHADELNVDEGESLTLTADMAPTGGTVAGTLVLENMTLTLANNIFAGTATVVLSNATIQGFSGITEATFSNAFQVPADTTNCFRNITDSYSHEGCDVYLNGSLSGSGALDIVSTGRGVLLGTDASQFTGTLSLNMTGGFFNGRLNTSLRNATVNIVGGSVNFNMTDAYFGSLNVYDGATFNDDRGWNDSNNIHLYGDSDLAGTFTGNEIDLNLHNNAKVRIEGTVARVNIESATLSGNGTIGKLKTWGNSVSVSNGTDSVLKINSRQSGDTGVITIVGEAGKPSGNEILQVLDTSAFNVAISSELAAKGWKLSETGGVYSIFRPGFAILVR